MRKFAIVFFTFLTAWVLFDVRAELTAIHHLLDTQLSIMTTTRTK